MNMQYIGARYVPKFYEGKNGAEWESNKAYEALTIVTYNNGSYTSKIPVPASVGNPQDNSKYWANNGDYNAQVAEYKEKARNMFGYFVTPEMFGAEGDGVTDDSEALSEALNSFKPVMLGGTYFVNQPIYVRSKAVAVYGKNGTVQSTVATELSNIYFNVIFGDGGQIICTDITGITFENVTFRGTKNNSKHIVLQSFRNSFIHCGFKDFATAINIEQGNKYSGENRIQSCTFNNCDLCVKASSSADWMLFDNLIDGTCGSIVDGTFSGVICSRNHFYNKGVATTLSAYNTLISDNYFDGVGMLEVKAQEHVQISNNIFVTGTYSGNRTWLIHIVDPGNHTINDYGIKDNYVMGSGQYHFIELDSTINFFRRCVLSGNNFGGCQYVTNKFFNFNSEQSVFHHVTLGGALSQSDYAMILPIRFGNFTFVALTSKDDVTLNVANVCRVPGYGYFQVFVTLKNGNTEWRQYAGQNLDIPDYANIKNFRVWAFTSVHDYEGIINFTEDTIIK